MGNELDTILAKPASQWTNEEANLVFKTMREYGRDTVKTRMEQVRLSNT